MQGKNLEYQSGAVKAQLAVGAGIHTRALDLSCCPLTEAANSGAQSPPGPCPPPHPPHRSVSKCFTKHSLCSQPCWVRFITVNPLQLLSYKAGPALQDEVQVCVRAPASGSTLRSLLLLPCTLMGGCWGQAAVVPSPHLETSPVKSWDPRVWATQPVLSPETPGQHSGAGSPRVGHPPTRQGEGPRVQADKPLPYQQNLYHSLII